MAENILIIGATSRVAEEIAQVHLARGDRLFLLGRDAEKLNTLAKRLRTEASALAFDFLDYARVAPSITQALDTLGSIERVYIAHGYLGDQLKSEEDFAEARVTTEVNLLSVLAFVIPIANLFGSQGHGRLCVLGSVAGERGRPRNYTYASAKAAVHIYLEGVRSRLWRQGIGVTTIKLGPVDTPMTANHSKNLLFSTPESVARDIVAACDRKKGNVFVPGYFRWILWVVKSLPERLFQRIPSLSGR